MSRLAMIELVESAYALDGSHDAWLERVARAADTLVASDGMLVALELAHESATVRRVAAPGLGSSTQTWVRSALTQASLDRTVAPGAALHMLPAITWLSSRFAQTEPAVRLFRELARGFGADDFAVASAHDGGPAAVVIQFPAASIAAPRVRALSRALPHVCAGLRLRASLGQAATTRPLGGDFVLDSRGRLHEGDASPDLREVLRHAVVSRERARTSASGDDVAGWVALVDGRWSLLDVFERGSRRYVVAVPNAPNVRHPRSASPAERAVLALVLLGRSNKAIAYELGIAESTVAAHLHHVRMRLGPALVRATAASLELDAPLAIGGTSFCVLVSDRDEERRAALELLTLSERDVVHLTLAGMSNAEIAQERGTAIRTVANQLASVYRKLHLGSRRELSARLGVSSV